MKITIVKTFIYIVPLKMHADALRSNKWYMTFNLLVEVRLQLQR